MSAAKSSDTHRAAVSFASALDRCEFDEAGPHLCDACTYQIGGSRIVGRAPIVDSYRDNAEWAAKTLDEVLYESDVRALPDGRIEITFTDHIFHAGKKHTYRCCQILSFDEDCLISLIEHVELAGQRELLDSFLAACGIDRAGT